jgi:ribose transport system permease protein
MRTRSFFKKNFSVIMTFIVAAFLFVMISAMRPGYANINNIRVLCITASFLGLTAMGQMAAILTGGMDLSIPWMFTIASFLTASLTNGENWRLVYAVPVVLLAGIVMGAFNGLGIAYVGIAPVIMTMASNIIFQGLLVGLTGGTPGGSAPQALKDFANGNVGGISTILLFWIGVSVFFYILIHRSPYGRRLFAVGHSDTVALYSGVNVKLIRASAYMICGFFAALAGMLYSGRVSQLYLGMGDPYQMDSVSAVAIGGVSLLGGSGNYIGTMGGVLVLVMLNGVLSALGLEQSVQKIIFGIVLFLAVLLSSRKQTGR